jgi:hypothetical protein
VYGRIDEPPEPEGVFFASDTFRGELKPRYVEVIDPPVEKEEVGTSAMDLSELQLDEKLDLARSKEAEPPTLLSSVIRPNMNAET